MLNWRQLLADVIKRRPRRRWDRLEVYVHSIVVTVLSDLRVWQYVVQSKQTEISKLTLMIGTHGLARGEPTQLTLPHVRHVPPLTTDYPYGPCGKHQYSNDEEDKVDAIGELVMMRYTVHGPTQRRTSDTISCSFEPLLKVPRHYYTIEGVQPPGNPLQAE